MAGRRRKGAGDGGQAVEEGAGMLDVLLRVVVLFVVASHAAYG